MEPFFGEVGLRTLLYLMDGNVDYEVKGSSFCSFGVHKWITFLHAQQLLITTSTLRPILRRFFFQTQTVFVWALFFSCSVKKCLTLPILRH